MVDALFAEPRLARLYDVLDNDRSDLDVYAALVDELCARSVLDVGCGTGTFACLLARRGLEVVGLDPAVASLDVARRKPGADAVCWLEGDATTLPAGLRVDLATMTGNVAQVFISDTDWLATLRAVARVLNPSGHFVFETRDPRREAWREWNRTQTHRWLETADEGRVETWEELTEVNDGLVTFRTTFTFERDGATLTSESTLRFRGPAEIDESLHEAGFSRVEVRDAPDRPGREFVYIVVLDPPN